LWRTAGLAAAALLFFACTPALSASAAAHKPVLAIIWHVAPPDDADAQLQAAQVALQAPDTLGTLLRALQRHPAAHVSLAADASYLNALRAAAEGNTALQAGMRNADYVTALRILARPTPGQAQTQSSPAGRRCAAFSGAARILLDGGRGVHFSADDLRAFAACRAMLQLVRGGFLPPASALLHASSLGAKEQQAAAELLRRSDKALYAQLQQLARRGSLEVIAEPAYEPVLPLLIDAAGMSALESANAHVVMLDARVDAERAVDDGLKAASAVMPGKAVGLYSPYGAYDDATAQLLQRKRVAYAIFSDRILKSAEAGGSAQAAQSAESAAYHAFTLQTDKAAKLSAFFCDDSESTALSNLPPLLPVSALAERVAGFASAVASKTSAEDGTPIALLRIDADGLWSRRADAPSAVERMLAMLESGRAGSAQTPAEIAHMQVATRTAYGFAAGSAGGSFSLWMGSANQAALWQALVDARKAAGGDAAISKPAEREVLQRSEAAFWYSLPVAPQSRLYTGRLLDQFRANIAAIYRHAGMTPPRRIAPFSGGLPVAVPAR
jgi:hypothetical protein